MVTKESQITFKWNKTNIIEDYTLVILSSEDQSLVQSVTTSLLEASFELQAGKYTWYVYQELSSPSPSRSFQIINNSTLTGAAVWLDAGNVVLDATSKPETWLDQSGNNNNFTQTVAARRPSLITNWQAMNGMPVIDFVPGQQHFFNGPDLSSIGSAEAFCVLQSKAFPATASQTSGIWTFGTSGAHDHLPLTDGNIYSGFGRSNRFNIGNQSQVIAFTSPYIVNIRTASQYSFRMNGTEVFNTTTGNAGFPAVTFFGRSAANHYFNGYIAEFILMSGEIAPSMRVTIEDYLYHKYAPPVNLGADITVDYGFCPVTLNAAKPYYTSYLWNTGSTASEISIENEGLYWVEVTNTLGRTSRDTVLVQYPGQFEFQDAILCVGETIELSPLLEGDYTYVWSNNAITPSITVVEGGSYQVTVTDNVGCSRSSNLANVAEDFFTQMIDLGSDADLCIGNELGLLQGGDVATSYLWSTGATTPTIVVNESGTYSVEVNNENNCTGFDSIEINILGEAPTLDFSADTTCFGELSVINNLSLIPEGTIVQSINWSFEGGSSELFSPEINLTQTGNNPVTLSISLDNGCSNEITKDLVVWPNPSIVLTGDQLVCVGVPFVFDASVQVLPPDATEQTTWLINNEEAGNELSLETSLNEPGEYEITVIVQTLRGCANSTSLIVQAVSNAPLSSSFSLVLPDDDAKSTHALQEFSWNISEGAKSYILEIDENIEFPNPLIFHTFQTSASIELPQTGTYYWRVIALNVCENPSISETRQLSFFEKASFNGIGFWLEAENVVTGSNNRVSAFIDQSNNGLSFTQANAANQPLKIENWPSLNNLPVVDFTFSSQQFINCPDLSGNSQAEIFAILQIKNFPALTNLSGAIWTFGTNALHDFFPFTDGNIYTGFGRNTRFTLPNPSSTFEMTQPLLVNISSAESFNFRLNEETLFSSSTGEVALPSVPYIGRSAGNHYFNGYMAEIVFFNQELSPDDRSFIRDYLFDKYAPPVNLGTDIRVLYGFCPVNISAGSIYTEYLWNTGETTESISVDQPGVYSVTVTDVFGRTSEDEIIVSYPGNFLEADFPLCIGDTFTYSTRLKPSDYEFTWNTGSIAESIDIFEGGSFQVTVNDTLGCSFTSQPITVTIDSFPVTAALINPPTFCLGNELFLSSGFAEAEQYSWSTEETTPFISPQEDGEYWVEALNPNGCIGRDTVEIVIAGIAPEAAVATTAPCQNNVLGLEDATVPEGGVVVDWAWSLGFGSAQPPAQGPSAEVTPTDTGPYPIALTVTLDNGCTGTLRDTLNIRPQPLVNFSVPIVCAGNPAFFEDLSGVPGGIPIAQRSWTFGNGGTAQGVVGSTTFAELGLNTVALEVVSIEGCQNALEVTVQVLGSPIANFEAEDVCIGSPVVFSENVDTSVSGPVFYNWQFGNGFFSNFPNTSHVYSAPGEYTVTLTATGNNLGNAGCTDQAVRTVRVYPAPTAVANAADVCLGAPTVLSDLSTAQVLAGNPDPITGRQWVVNGTPLSANGAEQSYVPNAGSGSYSVGLQITTQAGCTAAANASFVALPIPEAAFSLDIPERLPPLTATPVNTSTDAQGFVWLIDGAVVSTEVAPVLEFAEAGEYLVQLAAVNSLGCNDTASFAAKVIAPEYDLALLGILPTESGGRLRLELVVQNRGNVPVRQFDLGLNVGEDIFAESRLDVLIAPGSTEAVVVPTEWVLRPGSSLPYVCAELGNPNGIADFTPPQEESNLDNNRLCVALNRPGASFGMPYPNPAAEFFTLPVVLPQNGTLRLVMTDAQGRRVRSASYQLEAGVHMVEWPVNGVQAGVYLIGYEFGGEVVQKRVVVAR